MNPVLPFSPAIPQATSLPDSAALPQRIPSLDVLWGVALLGILLLNIQLFGMTRAGVYQVLQGPHGGSYWLQTLIHILFEDKMQALFSMLFGAGIILFLDKRQLGTERATPELFVRRQLWLILFGLINALVLLWPYDILFHYGIVGILLFPFKRLSARALLLCSIVVGLIYSGKNYWNFADQKTQYGKYQKVVALEKKNRKIKLTDEQKSDKEAWEGVANGSKYDKKADKEAIIAMRSGYTTVWSHLLPQIQKTEASSFYQFGLWDIVSMMLLGMALCKWGFFSNQLTTKQYVLLAIGGLLIGQTAAWLVLPAHELRNTDLATFISTNKVPPDQLTMPFERAFSAIGWASLVLLMYRLDVGMWLWKGLQAVGQMVFTNYLMQSIICTFLFYGYGMGYFGSLTFYQLYFIVAEIWLIQTVFSVVWLHYFRFGPLEWLWRSLTYGKRQPMSLSSPVTSPATPVFS